VDGTAPQKIEPDAMDEKEHLASVMIATVGEATGLPQRGRHFLEVETGHLSIRLSIFSPKLGLTERTDWTTHIT
jgi:hypothetical protein